MWKDRKMVAECVIVLMNYILSVENKCNVSTAKFD